MSIYDVTPVSFADYRRRARRKLPRFLFDYIDGGANDETSAAENESPSYRPDYGSPFATRSFHLAL